MAGDIPSAFFALFAPFAVNIPNPIFFLLGDHCSTTPDDLRAVRKFSRPVNLWLVARSKRAGSKPAPYESDFFFAYFALFAVKLPNPNLLYYVTFVPFVVTSFLSLWLRLRRARPFVVKISLTESGLSQQ